jgi:hypothetical protein
MNTNNSTNKEEKSFPENMLKGRMAETLIEELLKKSGNTVYRFGYEAIVQNLTQIKKSFDLHNDAGERIRAIPDFIVVDDKGEPIFVEVKFRWNGELHDNDILRLKKIGEFWKAKIIFVNSSNKPYFNISSRPYIDGTGKLISKPLSEDTGLKIDPKVYTEFEGLVERYLSLTL